MAIIRSSSYEDPNESASYQFLADLQTRISTRAIPYQYGAEVKALESLWAVFDQARAAIKANPGCDEFTRLVTSALNDKVRPITAKWDHAHSKGILNSRDGAADFRVDLETARDALARLASELRKMPERLHVLDKSTQRPESESQGEVEKRGTFTSPSAGPDSGPMRDEDVTGPDSGPMLDKDVERCLLPLHFGVPDDWGVDQKEIGIDEREDCDSKFPVDPSDATKKAVTPNTEGRMHHVLAATGRTLHLIGRRIKGLVVKEKGKEFSTKYINRAESVAVRTRRAELGFKNLQELQRNQNALGLAMSGGGIRSAVFCLGVTQVLAARKLLGRVDFLSTVSGGGYTGSFLTARLGDDTFEVEMVRPNGRDSKPIAHLRGWAQYMTSSSLSARWKAMAATVAGMLLNWSVPVFWISLTALLARYITKNGAEWNSRFPVTMELSVYAAAASLVAYAGLIRVELAKLRRWGEIIAALSLTMVLLVGVLWAIYGGYQCFDSLLKSRSHLTLLFTALPGAVGLMIAAGPILLRFFPMFSSAKTRNYVVGILLMAAGLIVPILLLATFYTFYYLTGNSDEVAWLRVLNGEDSIKVVAAITFLLLILINVNETSPHRLYRDSLARTFIWERGKDPTTYRLHEINKNGLAPYHLINATVNLPSTKIGAIRERKCDFFLFSKYFCGSKACGYHQTSRWKRGRFAGMDLATAMAISGAAASPLMGMGTKSLLKPLLTLLNVRLGFWIRHPQTRALSFRVPGWVCLLKEMSGVKMDERGPWLYLSDGGHIENMAVYELLRRRCKFIICVDGESDSDYEFTGLMTLVRHARIDFGVRIEPNLDEIRPNGKTGYSRAHATFCRIHYPKMTSPSDPNLKSPSGEDEIGLLLYMKLSLTGNESELISRYRSLNPKFPHQTTLDQFFDEEQFEVYRELGVHVAQGLFSEALVGKEFSKNGLSVEDWFECLVKNMLEPEQ